MSGGRGRIATFDDSTISALTHDQTEDDAQCTSAHQDVADLDEVDSADGVLNGERQNGSDCEEED